MHCEITLKMLIKIEIFSFQVVTVSHIEFFLEHWIYD